MTNSLDNIHPTTLKGRGFNVATSGKFVPDNEMWLYKNGGEKRLDNALEWLASSNRKYQISSHIRRYLLEKYQNKCSSCGWCEVNVYTNNIPLEIDHIDGNYLNNNEGNLRLLCPNCHSLTSTYKNANAGNGRKERSKYNQ